ncbi:plasmolipin-like [Clytia hemisphaerica]|uniref:MARVEL domain-containing protein n=1 Tax=Clytia hemisphaerica TaxID=252671 RepID=A0A7M5V4E5_9CNID|eukprot:TCONS_00002055-protein
MDDEVGQGTYEGRRQQGFTLDFVRSPPGILLVVNTVILFLCWTIIAGWRTQVHPYIGVYYEGNTGYYLTTTIIPFLILLTVFVLKMLRLHKKIPKIVNWSLTMAINCAVWSVLLFISSCVVGDMARKLNPACEVYLCHHLGACAAFGFFGCIGLGAQAFLHFREWRQKSAGGLHSATKSSGDGADVE